MNHTTSHPQSQDNPDIFAVETEAFAASRALLLLWRRAVDLHNCRLGESVAAAGRASNLLHEYANPAVIALMIDGHVAAHAGMSIQEWLTDIGGPTPELEILSGLDALPLAFSALHSDFMERFSEAFDRRLEDHTDPADAPAPAATSELLTTQQLAVWLHCSPRTISRKVEQGELPPPAIDGKPKRWLRTAVNDWLHEHPVQRRRVERAASYFPGRR